MKFRKIIFWSHLVAGVTAGTVIFILCVTGVLLAFERQITAWADRGYRCEPPSAGMARFPVETLVARVSKTQEGGSPAAVTLQSDLNAPASVSFGREKSVFVNPYTGTVLGEGSKNVRAFFRKITEVHRWLATTTETRAIGKGITRASNLVFLVLVVSGFYLWWPRQWTKNVLRSVALPSFRLRGKSRDWNWHNAIGLWCAVPLFFIVITGALISYGWATNLLYRLTGSEPPPVRAGTGPGEGMAGRERGKTASIGGGREAAPATEPKLDGLNQLWIRAEQQVSDWKSITLRLPTSATAPVVFSIDRGNGGRPDKRSQLTLDRETGEVKSWETFETFNLGRRLRSWGRFVHTGEAGGMVGQTLAALASAGGAVLVWTGFALAWRRFRGRNSKSFAENRPIGNNGQSQ